MNTIAYAALGLAQKGFAITSSHVFTDTTTRDTYFTGHTPEKVTGVYISVGTGFQQWNGSTWVDKTAIVQGIKGDSGNVGQGVPIGGTSGQFLSKNSINDYDTRWVNAPINGNGSSNIFFIDPTKWGIYTDGTHSLETSIGINAALQQAAQSSYDTVYLGKGTYLIDAFAHSIIMPDKVSLYMHPDCILQVETNYHPSYSVIKIYDCSNLEIHGGQIIGDRNTHIFELFGNFESGSLDVSGQPVVDATTIRSTTFIDSSIYPNFFGEAYDIFKNASVITTTADVYLYDINNVFIRKDIGITLKDITAPVYSYTIKPTNAVKMKVVLTQSDPTGVQVALRNGVYSSHEFGYGIQLMQCTNVNIVDCYISKCTGDSIIYDWTVNTYQNPSEYCIVDHCTLDNSRRQGISVINGNHLTFRHCIIKNIGGVAPEYGIDIEDENHNGWYITIEDCEFSGNTAGDIDNYNGKHTIIRRCTFGSSLRADGGAIGGVFAYNCIYEDNIFNGQGIGTAILCLSDSSSDYSAKWNIIRGNVIKNFTSAVVCSWAGAAYMENNYIENCTEAIRFSDLGYLHLKGNTYNNNTNVKYITTDTIVNSNISEEKIYNSLVTIGKKMTMLSSNLTDCTITGNGALNLAPTFLNCEFDAQVLSATRQLVAYDGDFKFLNCVFKGTITNAGGTDNYYINAGTKVSFIGCLIHTNACKFLQTYENAIMKDCFVDVNATTPVAMFYSTAFNPAKFIIEGCHFRNTGSSAMTIRLGTSVSVSYFINNINQGLITLLKDATHTEINTIMIP